MAPLVRGGAPWAVAAAVVVAQLSAFASGALLRASAQQPRVAVVEVVPPPAVAAAAAAEELAAPADWAPSGDAKKVERLLLDIDESVKKAGTDAELAYATLLSYDQQMASSVNDEIDTLGKELNKLKNMQNNYKKNAVDAGKAAAGPKKEVEKKEVEKPSLGTSHRVAGTGNANLGVKSFDRMEAIRLLLGYMEHGSMSKLILRPAEQQLSKQQLVARSMFALQHLLMEHQVLQPRFHDVYVAFVPRAFMSSALIQEKTAKNVKAVKGPRRVRLTPALRQHTIAALKTIQAMIQSGKSQALLQTGTQQKATMEAATAEANSHERQGIQADEEKNAQELAFSVTFAEAVLRIDHDFQSKVLESMAKKANLVSAARTSRETQHKTLLELVDLLRGRYVVDELSGQKEDVASALGQKEDQMMDAFPSEGSVDFTIGPEESVVEEEIPLAFMQVAAKGSGAAGGTSKAAAKSSEGAGGAMQVTNLQQEIETALRKKENTHGILLKVQAMLDRDAPVSADSVQQVVNDLGGVLRDVEGEQSRSLDVKRKCEEQTVHASREDQQMRANLALMITVRNRTKAAIEVAKRNLVSIVNKTKNLESSTQEFSNIVAKMSRTLEDQSRDRATIMAAVRKAREIVARRTSAGPAADALLYRMLQEVQSQDAKEREYRSEEVNAKDSFMAYTRGYLQLLQERRGHYQSSLSALELYSDEVESDAAAQAATLGTDGELQKESRELCAGIMLSYRRHSNRRKELSRMLRTVIPEMPGVMN